MFLEIHRFSFEWKILEWFNKIDSSILDYFFYIIILYLFVLEPLVNV